MLFKPAETFVHRHSAKNLQNQFCTHTHTAFM